MLKPLKIQKGNAMTEFVVLAMVMVPVMAFIPVLGKMSDTNQATIEAARYVAWERTVSDASQKSDSQIATEVSNRFFRRDSVAIESDQGLLDEEQFRNQFWSSGKDENGDSVSLINADENNLFVSTSNQSIPSNTGAGQLSDGISAIGSAMEGFIPGANWDLEANGFYVAEVGVNVASNRFLSSGQDCSGQASDAVSSCMNRRNAIFVDAWNSESPDQTKERVKALVPGGALEPVGDFMSNLGSMPLFKELGRMKGIFGDVKEDVLPLDRYSEGIQDNQPPIQVQDDGGD